MFIEAKVNSPAGRCRANVNHRAWKGKLFPPLCYDQAMKRDPAGLARREWDVIVIGGGIHGAFAARELALHGLSVALVEKGDFASATSSHSQKIVHNGLRYLQHGDLARLRQSVRERSALLRIAPHLVRVLPVLVPAYGHGLKGRELLSLGLAAHDLLGIDRNRGLPPFSRIPAGRTVGPEECRRLFPEVDTRGLTGGAVWYDGQVANTERLILSLLHDLAARGGSPHNYLEVTGLPKEGGRVVGVTVRDALQGGGHALRARLVLNAAGPWLGGICRLAGVSPPEPAGLSRAVVLVVGRPLVRECAVGLPSRSRFHDPDVLLGREERFFFITPWRGVALVGSAHLPFDGRPDDCTVAEEEIDDFLGEVNAACPSWALTRADVTYVYRGLLPTAGVDEASGSIRVEKTQRIVDHAEEDGTEGLVSILGVKYTTARDAAAKAASLALRKLGRPLREIRSDFIPVHGAKGWEPGSEVPMGGGPAGVTLEPPVLAHLARTYGTAWTDLLPLLREHRSAAGRVHPSSAVIAAELVHGIRHEMALKLTDLLLRRTELGSAGHPGDEVLQTCSRLAARELGWDEERRQREVEEAEEAFAL